MAKSEALVEFEPKAAELVKSTGHSELYGIEFGDPATWSTPHERILTKFLVANKNDVALAAEQLKKTLEWRKEFNPLKARDEKHRAEFELIGVLTKSPNGKVLTWNLYGAVKDRKALFAKLEEFIRWRVGIMERGIAHFDWSSEELSYMDQVHDYMDVSFFRLDGETRKASGTIIKLFQDYYPEFLSAKYFVNVPYVMSWMFAFAKTFMSRDTSDKFHVVSNGKDLRYDLGEWIPVRYGGKGPSLEELSIKRDSPATGATGSEPSKTPSKAAAAGIDSTVTPTPAEKKEIAHDLDVKALDEAKTGTDVPSQVTA